MTETFTQYKDKCVEEISALQNGFKTVYDLNSYENWSFNEDFGVFHFESNGEEYCTFDILWLAPFHKKHRHGNGRGTMNILSLMSAGVWKK